MEGVEEVVVNQPVSEDREAVAFEITRTMLRIINRAHRFRNLTFGESARLTMVEGEICTLIEESDEATAMEIARDLGVSRSALTQVLNRLRAKGYVDESVDEGNRRRKLLRLTPLGLEATQAARSYLQLMNDELFGDASEEDLSTYLRFVSEFDAFHESVANALVTQAAAGSD